MIVAALLLCFTGTLVLGEHVPWKPPHPCPDDKIVCILDPCDDRIRPSCPACPKATCVSDYCDFCYPALFKLKKRWVNCLREEFECENPAPCVENPCKFVQPPRGGHCVPNFCDDKVPCKAVCFDKNCRKVRCRKNTIPS